jgi:hypothetical protein
MINLRRPPVVWKGHPTAAAVCSGIFQRVLGLREGRKCIVFVFIVISSLNVTEIRGEGIDSLWRGRKLDLGRKTVNCTQRSKEHFGPTISS